MAAVVYIILFIYIKQAGRKGIPCGLLIFDIL